MDLKAHFDAVATSYTRSSGNPTVSIAAHILTLFPPLTSASVVHDNACGPGTVTFGILSHLSYLPPSDLPTIHATDYSANMIAALQSRLSSSHPEAEAAGKVTAAVLDSADLCAFPDDYFTHSITSFGLFCLPDPVAGAAEIRRTLRPGGTAVVTTWKVSGAMDLIHRVQAKLNAQGALWWPVDEEWMKAEKLRDVLLKGGFTKEKLRIEEREAWMGAEDEEGLVEMFCGGFWEAAIKATVSDGERGRWRGAVRECLSEEEKERRGVKMVAWVAVVTKE